MAKESLYKICLQRVKILLIEETWKYCSVNPFSNFPSKIIDDVMELMKIESIHLLRPLITSNTLTRLKLLSHHFKEESYLFQEETLNNCFECLRYLNCLTDDDSHIPLIQKLLRSSPQLEEFHSTVELPLDALETCKKLKVLRFNLDFRETKYELSNKRLTILSSLRNLKVVSYIANMDIKSIANILKCCPQLISIGSIDTLSALEMIHANIPRECETDGTDKNVQLQLKRCIWGKNEYELNYLEEDVNLYKSSFPDKIKYAVSVCPFVEKLSFFVHHSDSMEHLKNLKRLSSLEIRLDDVSDCMEKFIAVLEVIGPQLKYLNFLRLHPVPVDKVCDLCHHLETLKITHLATIDGDLQPRHKVSLKRLYIMYPDQPALLFLATCKGLVELHIGDASFLDDTLLDQILRFNPLAQLKHCRIIKSRLSQEGFRMILKKVVSLETVRFGHRDRNIKTQVEYIINELHLNNVTYEKFYTTQDDFYDNFKLCSFRWIPFV